MPTNQRDLALELDSTGIPPVMFGMTEAEARNAMTEWGAVTRLEYPGETPRLRVRDDDLTRDVFANLEDGVHVTSMHFWRPKPGPSRVTLHFDSVDLFAEDATEVVWQLIRRGFEVDDSDPYHPELRRSDLTIGLNLEGGDDVDDIADDGLSRVVLSLLVAPGGYGQTD